MVIRPVTLYLLLHAAISVLQCWKVCDMIRSSSRPVEEGYCNLECNIESCGFDVTPSGQNECLEKCLSTGCNLQSLQDGVCDEKCNNSACGFDAGDCGYCAGGCFRSMLDNGVCDPECNLAECDYDSKMCDQCAPGCFTFQYVGNEICNLECDVASCMFDAGDCQHCSPDCLHSDIANGQCNLACLTPLCGFDYCDCVGRYEGECLLSRLGDGVCDHECYTEATEWDWGDCDCISGCSHRLQFNDVCDPECNYLDCQWDNHKCVRSALEVCSDGCFEEMLGNGSCDGECNTVECQFDYGDCLCHEGCDSTNFESCSPECLNYACGYANFGREYGCGDSFALELALTTQALTHNLFASFSWPSCLSVDDNCEASEFESMWIESMCYKDDSLIHCAKEECSYTLGLCTQLLHSTCARGFGMNRNQCFECKSGYVRHYTTCLLECPRRSQRDPILSLICTPRHDDSTLDDFDQIFVFDSTKEGEGTLISPFGNLPIALAAAWKKYTVINLLGDKVQMIADLTSENPEIVALDSLYNPLANSDFSLLVVQSLTCEDQITEHCSSRWAEIDLFMPVVVNVSFPVEFRRVVFINERLFDGLSVKFCPVLEELDGQLLNSLGEYASDDEITASTLCDAFASYSVFVVRKGGALTMKVKFMQEVNVTRVAMRVRAFIEIQEGNVQLEEVHFDGVHTLHGYLVPAGVILQSNNCANVVCGSFSYNGGSVTYLNNGIDYVAAITLSPFVYGRYLESVVISSVTFAWNLVVDSYINTLKLSKSGLLYLENFYELQVSDCSFTNNFVTGGVVVVSSYVELPKNARPGEDFAYLYQLDHILLTQLSFTSNLCECGVIKIVFSKDVLNVKLSMSYFDSNSIEGYYVTSVQNENSPTSGVVYGETQYVLNPLSGEKEDLFIAPRHVTFSGLTITNAFSFSSLFNVQQCANLLIWDVKITDSGDYGVDVFGDFFYEFSAHTLAVLWPEFPSTVNCYSSFNIDATINFVAKNITIQRLWADNGNCGFYVFGPCGSSDVSSFEFSECICYRYTGVAFTTYSELNLRMSDLTIISNENILGEMLYFGYATKVSVYDSLFTDNVGIIGSVMYFTQPEYFQGVGLQFRRNSAPASTGGALYWWVGPMDTSISLLDSEFEENSAQRAGVLAIEAGRPTLLLLLIERCRFTRNRANSAGAIYFSTLITFSSGSQIAHSQFLGHSNSIGTVYLGQSGGELSIHDNSFTANAGSVASNLVIESLHEAITIIERVIFQDSRDGPTILESNANTNSTFFTRNCSFLHNEKSDVVLTGGYWEDSSSFFNGSTTSKILLTVQAIANLTLTQMYSNHDGRSGGAVHAMTSSTFLCTSCVFVNNSAGFSGGAVFIEQESVAFMKNCIFRNNSAASGGSVIFLSSSITKTSTIESSVMEGNDGGIFGVIFSQVSSFVLHNVTVRHNFGLESAGIIIMMSSIVIRNSVFGDLSGSTTAFLGLYTQCSAIISNSTFERGSCNSGGAIFLSSTSTLIVHSSSFFDLSAKQGGVVTASSNSAVEFSAVTITKSRSGSAGSLFDLSESSLVISNSTFTDYSGSGISAKQLGRVDIQASHFLYGSGQMGAAAYFFQCASVKIVNCEFTHHKSEVGGALAFEALENKNLGTVQIQSCTFSNNSAMTAGAVYITNQHIGIIDGTFISNAASDGGALFLSCTIIDMCKFNIVDSEFRNNTALVRGGGISWTNVKPTLVNLTLTNNSAEYGADVASFAALFQVDALLPKSSSRILSDTITAAPGQMIDTAIVASLRDHYGQVISIDNFSVGVIGATSPEVTVSGVTKVLASKGIFVFENFMVIAKPNTSATIEASSSSVSTADDPHGSSALLNFSIRSCVPGEFESSVTCNICSPGTYSFKPSVPCQTCESNSVCLGNKTVYPESGYWRSSEYSAIIRECPNPSSCLGGLQSDKPLSPTGYCAVGYKGNLCQSCHDDYSRTGKNKCGKCPPRNTNIVRITFIAIAMLIVIVVMVWSTMRSATRPAAIHSIMIRIFVNYLQLVLLVSDFKLSWPRPVLELFSSQESAGGVTEQAYSFDCFLSDGKADSDTFYKKSVFIALLPIPLILGSLAVWGVIAAKRRSKTVLKRECAATIIILFFMILPNLIKSLFSMFSCTEIESGEYWLTVDLDIRCWSDKHNFYTRAVGLPGILVWVVGVPFCCLGVLAKYRRQHDELWIKRQYGFLINGYRRRCYYWEFVVLYRKILVIVCNVFLISSITVQALTVQFILILAFFLHYVTRPYVIDKLNSVEAWAIIVADVTIYCGLYYLSAGIAEVTSWLLFLIIVLANLTFILYWLFELLGQVIDMVCESVPILQRVLRPGRFRDKFIEDFLAHIRKHSPQAEKLSGMNISTCYRKMLRQQVPDISQSRYSPRSICPPESEDESDRAFKC